MVEQPESWQWIMNVRKQKPLDHRFLNGVPCAPKGSVERVLGVRKDHKSKLLYPFKPLLQGLRGPPMGLLTFRGLWKFFWLIGFHRAIKVENHCFRFYLQLYNWLPKKEDFSERRIRRREIKEVLNVFHFYNKLNWIKWVLSFSCDVDWLVLQKKFQINFKAEWSTNERTPIGNKSLMSLWTEKFFKRRFSSNYDKAINKLKSVIQQVVLSITNS